MQSLKWPSALGRTVLQHWVSLASRRLRISSSSLLGLPRPERPRSCTPFFPNHGGKMPRNKWCCCLRACVSVSSLASWAWKTTPVLPSPFVTGSLDSIPLSSHLGLWGPSGDTSCALTHKQWCHNCSEKKHKDSDFFLLPPPLPTPATSECKARTEAGSWD